MSDFDQWWRDTGSQLPLDSYDRRKLAQSAWIKGHIHGAEKAAKAEVKGLEEKRQPTTGFCH